MDRRGERRGDGAGAGASAAGARPREDRRRAPAPANFLQPLSMCCPMTDKATVASQIGQRAQPSSSALRGVSSMWNDLSGVWLDSFRLNFEQQAWLLYLKLLAIREALSTVIGRNTAAQNQAV